jgi:hypothetical protein
VGLLGSAELRPMSTNMKLSLGPNFTQKPLNRMKKAIGSSVPIEMNASPISRSRPGFMPDLPTAGGGRAPAAELGAGEGGHGDARLWRRSALTALGRGGARPLSIVRRGARPWRRSAVEELSLEEAAAHALVVAVEALVCGCGGAGPHRGCGSACPRGSGGARRQGRRWPVSRKLEWGAGVEGGK